MTDDAHATPEVTKRGAPALTGVILLLLAVLAVVIYTFFSLNKRLSQLEQGVAALGQAVPDLPQATIDAIIALQNGQSPSTAQTAPAPGEPLSSIDDDAVVGDRSAARLVMIEFSDFNCPYCARFHADTLQPILDKYVQSGQMLYVYRDFVGVGGNATLGAAAAAECARAQVGDAAYLDLVSEIYAASGTKNSALVNTFAEQLELDQTQFDACLEADTYRQEVLDDTRAAQAAGGRGTPTFVVGQLDSDGAVRGLLMAGAQPFEVFDRVIQEQLAELEKE